MGGIIYSTLQSLKQIEIYDSLGKTTCDLSFIREECRANMFDMSVKHRPPVCSITIMALRTGCKHRCGVALVRFQRNILISAYLMLSTTAKCYANYLTYLALSEPVVLSGLRNGTPALQFNFNNSKKYFPSATFL